MKYVARSEIHHYKNVVAAEQQIAHLEEIAAPDSVRLIAQKRRPSLTVGCRAAKPAHVALNGALGGAESELEELATNSLCSPESIVDRHPPDQLDHGRRQSRSWPRLRFGTPHPKQPESLPVPAQYGLGFDQHHRGPPSREHRRQRDQKDSLARSEPRPLDLARSDVELLSEHRVLGEQLLLGSQ